MIVVTGASGFLGTAIVDECRNRGIEVRPVALRGLDATELPSAFEGANAIIHAAGLAHGGGRFSPAEYRAVNVDLTRAVAEGVGIARVPRLVLVSSVSVYGGASPYATSKLEGERVATAAAQRHGTQLFVLRPVTIIGEGDPGNVLRLIRAIARRRFIWLGSGANRKTLIHRDDAARACVLAATADRLPPDVYDIAGDSPRMREILWLITRRLGRSPLRIPIPDALLRRAPLAVLRKFATDEVYDGARFARHAGFVPAIPWERALEREIDWYLTARAVPR